MGWELGIRSCMEADKTMMETKRRGEASAGGQSAICSVCHLTPSLRVFFIGVERTQRITTREESAHLCQCMLTAIDSSQSDGVLASDESANSSLLSPCILLYFDLAPFTIAAPEGLPAGVL